MKAALNILYLEDSRPDFELIRELLIDAGYNLHIDRVETGKEYISSLRKRTYDIILADFKVPGFDAFAALNLSMDTCPDVPFICVSGSIGEETAIELIKRGAVDYVLKDRPEKLPSAIQRALDDAKGKIARRRMEEDLKKSESKFRAIFDNASDGMILVDLKARKFFMCNPACAKMLGYTQEEFSNLDIGDIHPEEDLPFIYEQIRKFSRQEEGIRSDMRFKRKDGSIFTTDLSPALLTIAEKKYLLIIFKDVTERILADQANRRAEEALRESEKKYKAIFDGASEGILIADLETRKIKYANHRICSMLGYSADELVGLSVNEIHPPEHLQEVIAVFESQARGEIALALYVPCLRKDGAVLFAEINTTRIIIEGIPCNVGFFTDVTERKLAEEKLTKSEEKYRSIFENVQDVYYEAALDGTILEVSPSIETISKGQYHRDDLIGKSMYDFYSLAGGRQALLVLLQERGSVGDYEVMLKNRDGSQVPCSISAKIQLDSQGTPSKIIGSMRDITKRKQAEEALLESEAKYRTLVTQSPDGIFVVDLSGTFLSVNKAMCDNLKYSEEELLSMKIWDIVPQQYLSLHKNRIADIIKGENKKDPAEYEVKGKDGIVHFIEVLSTPYYKDKEIIGFQGIARDITQRRAMADQLRQMQKMEGLGTLAGGIAHDFNNILGIILAYITSIRWYKGDTRKSDLATDAIIKAVQRGKTLVNQILTFARKSDTEFGPVDINDIVMEIMMIMHETFPEILTYSQNIDKSIPFIYADRSQLHQAVLNLCVNARDVMPNGGILTINTHRVSGMSIRNQHPDAIADSYVCIEVSDTGEGMTDDIRNRIFEPFFTTKEKGKGTGLGLAVVFGVVQTHKGFINVESEHGKGTTFRLYLQASQAVEPIDVEAEEPIEKIPGGTETLLVVEDEENLMVPLLTILNEKGYTVLPTEDGLAAVKIYEERIHEIALVITDLGIPKLSGLDLCRRIKLFNPNARIIVATGFLDPEMKSELLKAGVKKFIAKPYNPKEILGTIRQVLDEK